MTTIAYKDGIIAYDSRQCCENTIEDDDFDKCIIREGIQFFISGFLSDFEDFLESFFANKNTTDRILQNVALIVIDGVLWGASFTDDKRFWKVRLKTNICHAYGSGGDHALTAMDMGATAKESVKWAMKRDCKTGGKIRTYSMVKRND